MGFSGLLKRRGWIGDTVKRVAGSVSVGLNGLLGSRAGNLLGILVYHRVSPRYPGIPEPTINVTPRHFRTQLAGLQQRGFVFRSLRDVLDTRAAGLPLAPRTVVVTFDDGYVNNYTRAWPILRELAIPATIFLATAFLDQQAPFPFDAWGRKHQDQLPAEAYRPLTAEQCQEMADGGLIELGAHTHTHQDFRGRPEAFQADLAESVRVIRDTFGSEYVPFAFPFGRRRAGYSGDDLVQATRQTGVRCALTTEAEGVDLAGDPFLWGRFNVYDFDTPATLQAKLDGWYGWAPRFQDWLTPGGRTT